MAVGCFRLSIRKRIRQGKCYGCVDSWCPCMCVSDIARNKQTKSARIQKDIMFHVYVIHAHYLSVQHFSLSSFDDQLHSYLCFRSVSFYSQREPRLVHTHTHLFHLSTRAHRRLLFSIRHSPFGAASASASATATTNCLFCRKRNRSAFYFVSLSSCLGCSPLEYVATHAYTNITYCA